MKPKMSELLEEATRFVALAKVNEPGLMTWLDSFHGSARRLRVLLDAAWEVGIENDTHGSGVKS